MNITRRRVTRKAAAALAAFVFIVALARPCPAQLDQWGYWENGVTESWWLSSRDFTKEDAVNAFALWRSIGEDNQKATGEEWSGDYFSGTETHGTYVRWSPRAGFIVANVDKCQALVMGVTYGRVEASPALVQFIPEFRKAAAKAHGHSPSEAHAPTVMRFVPVKWRGERLLVAENEMANFGDYLAGLGKYNHWDFLYSWVIEFFTKRDAGGAAAEAAAGAASKGSEAEATVVPPGYEHFLKKPIEAATTAVGSRRVRRKYSYEHPDGAAESYHEPVSITTVTLNVGAAHGVKEHMIFRVSEPAQGDKVRIIRTAKFSSTGVVVRSLDADGAETFYEGQSELPKRHARVAVGWKLTTSPF